MGRTEDPLRIVGRTLTAIEVSLAKKMAELELPRDEIISFFARPGRKLNPAFLGEIKSGKLGRDIPAAFEHEVKNFIKERLAESSILTRGFSDSEFSALRLFTLMEKAFGDQYSFLDDESDIFEYKLSLPQTKQETLNLCRTLSAFANNKGGFVFVGVNDDRDIVGLERGEFDGFDWDGFSNFARTYFQPSFWYDHQSMMLAEKYVGVICAREQDKKPVVCVKDFGTSLSESCIYYRYRGHSERIRAGDLMNLLAERDRRAAEVARREILLEGIGISGK